jgi:hypothetical protein
MPQASFVEIVQGTAGVGGEEAESAAPATLSTRAERITSGHARAVFAALREIVPGKEIHDADLFRKLRIKPGDLPVEPVRTRRADARRRCHG